MDNKIIVNTKTGKIKGYRAGVERYLASFTSPGVIKFKGIPFAEPPINELRFKSPISKKPWKGTLDATKLGPIAPRLESFPKVPGLHYEQSEAECLNLNIWTPSIDGELRPVMVWIHGGGFFTGSGANFEGSNLALRGNIVIVTINYRLGPLGFLYIEDETANVGLLDQIAAIRWIKENIHSFGGDPNNITIFGESAGAISVCILLTMPAARNLFQRVIAQSGPPLPADFKQSSRIKATNNLLANLGVKSGNIEDLRKIRTEKITKAHSEVLKSMKILDYLSFNIPYFGPVIEKNTLPTHPLEKFKKGFDSDIEFLIGSNLDEATTYSATDPNLAMIDENTLFKQTQIFLRALDKDINLADKLINLYKNTSGKRRLNTPRKVFDAICSDYAFRIPSILYAELYSKFQKKTYMYLFHWRSPLNNGRFGATHALEVPFVFGTLPEKDYGLHPKKNEITKILSNNMMDYWISFAQNGNPNYDGLLKWPIYRDDERSTMIFDNKSLIINAPYDYERAAWKDLLY
jgi:para-nitrobenzyl esterase